ncbi:NUDIX domain-containing protein [Lederbergia wuyishanensis]|uniref:ADP-ribose pyrophosphatase YjhB (NUDIX family) n=1 Tax=Lederbergia wuyishanensis TaxID=1347903 RepID=A0ABU0D3M2_9BACI|nr:NUDIX domain-containing protein [Lederbergia wuyishanensis]MCJ8007824.1 NUDIX domain-containing protein [Lederbergia wuyishanensis]MDQ0343008.1 ADP-ribose pyrophosphatase YjhB (NUDIX family) [Lederbergia wuyishanensis]
MNIRNSIKAIIINGENILLTKNRDHEGDFYLCPGGGQEHSETFHKTLVRECIEEIGREVSIAELLFIREYIGRNHEHSALDFNVHQVEYYFSCQLDEAEEMSFNPSNPDQNQIGIEWVPINDLLHYRLYPKQLRKYIIKQLNGEKTPIYLGDVN